VPPRKKIAKVLSEYGVRKVNEYIGQKRDSYQQALILKYAKLPKKRVISTAGAGDRWRSANRAHTVGAMNAFPDVYRGCKDSSSVLRPHHGITGAGLGTDAKSDVPEALEDLQAANFFADTFVSGHVMNADFGGVGSDPGNQTILTSMANSVHKGGWEGPVKKAQYFMTLVVKALRGFELDGTGTAIIDGIESNWRIELNGVVEDQSWWDELSATVQGSLTPPQAEIARSITTEVNFTAIARDTPKMSDFTVLKLDESRDEFVLAAKYLKSFKEMMDQVADFRLTQMPNGLGKATVSSY
jgi:hypothetical protein